MKCFMNTVNNWHREKYKHSIFSSVVICLFLGWSGMRIWCTYRSSFEYHRIQRRAGRISFFTFFRIRELIAHFRLRACSFSLSISSPVSTPLLSPLLRAIELFINHLSVDSQTINNVSIGDRIPRAASN